MNNLLEILLNDTTFLVQSTVKEIQWELIIGAILTAIVGPLVTIYANQYFKRRNLFKRVNRRIEIDSWVNGKLGCLLNSSGADRVYIFQMHPEHSPIYMSETYEVVSPGISNEIRGHQNLRLSDHNFVLSRLLKDGHFFCKDISCSGDENFRLSMDSHGVKSVYIKGIFSSQGHLKGFLAIDYIHNETNITPAIVRALDNLIYELSPKLYEFKGI